MVQRKQSKIKIQGHQNIICLQDKTPASLGPGQVWEFSLHVLLRPSLGGDSEPVLLLLPGSIPTLNSPSGLTGFLKGLVGTSAQEFCLFPETDGSDFPVALKTLPYWGTSDESSPHGQYSESRDWGLGLGGNRII